MKTTVHTDPFAPSYWSQYNRIHGKLGQMRGPGVERERVVRQSYNIFTGKQPFAKRFLYYTLKYCKAIEVNVFGPQMIVLVHRYRGIGSNVAALILLPC